MLSYEERDEMPMKVEHVAGTQKGKIMLYALSTCGWCEKTKALLSELGVEFNYVYVDLLPPDDMDRVMDEVEKYNKKGSFPTLVINDRICIVGFREQEIRGALG
jgi:glutaredoxin-like protein NrdH